MRTHVVTLTAMLALTQMLIACGAASHGTPAPTPFATSVASSPASQPNDGTLPTQLPQPGSFPAFCAAIHVRFLAPPRVMQDESSCRGNNLFLTTNITVDTGVEFFTVFRYTGDARGQTATGWGDILESFRMIDAQSGDTAWTAVSQPTAQAAQGNLGYIGQFTRTDKTGVRYVGALWAGAVGDDTVTILGQGSAEQQVALNSDMAQVLRTVDLNAQ